MKELLIKLQQKFNHIEQKDDMIVISTFYKNGNKKNWSLGNLELLCYNHYFLYVGNIFTDKQIQHIEDYSPPVFESKSDWELDDYYKDHFTNLGLIDDKDEPGSEFISKI